MSFAGRPWPMARRLCPLDMLPTLGAGSNPEPLPAGVTSAAALANEVTYVKTRTGAGPGDRIEAGIGVEGM